MVNGYWVWRTFADGRKRAWDGPFDDKAEAEAMAEMRVGMYTGEFTVEAADLDEDDLGDELSEDDLKTKDMEQPKKTGRKRSDAPRVA